MGNDFAIKMCRSASLPTHKLSNFLLLLKTPAGSFSIWFLVKLLQKGYMMDFSKAFLNCLPVREQKPSRLRACSLTSSKWQNSSQMAGESRPNRYYIWCLLVIYKKANSELFLKTSAGIFSSGFHLKFYDKIHITFITIFQRHLCSLCHIFPSSLSFFS